MSPPIGVSREVRRLVSPCVVKYNTNGRQELAPSFRSVAGTFHWHYRSAPPLAVTLGRSTCAEVAKPLQCRRGSSAAGGRVDVSSLKLAGARNPPRRLFSSFTSRPVQGSKNFLESWRGPLPRRLAPGGQVGGGFLVLPSPASPLPCGALND